MPWTPEFLIRKDELDKLLHDTYDELREAVLYNYSIDDHLETIIHSLTKTKIKNVGKALRRAEDEIRKNTPKNLDDEEAKMVFEKRYDQNEDIKRLAKDRKKLKKKLKRKSAGGANKC